MFQIASQVDRIIECTVEGAILYLKLMDIWEFPEARNLKMNTTVFNKSLVQSSYISNSSTAFWGVMNVLR